MSVCKVNDYRETDLNDEFVFIGKTDDEFSFNTDYILVHEADYEQALKALEKAGYQIVP
jgi:hypothetical protein